MCDEELILDIPGSCWEYGYPMFRLEAIHTRGRNAGRIFTSPRYVRQMY